MRALGLGAFVLQEGPDPFEAVSELLESPYLTIGFRVVALFFVVLWLALAYWTFADAGRRGSPKFF